MSCTREAPVATTTHSSSWAFAFSSTGIPACPEARRFTPRTEGPVPQFASCVAFDGEKTLAAFVRRSPFPSWAGLPRRTKCILPALLTSVAQALLPVRSSLRRNPPILAHARNRTQQSQEERLKPIPLKANPQSSSVGFSLRPILPNPAASRREGIASGVGSRSPNFNLLVSISSAHAPT